MPQETVLSKLDYEELLNRKIKHWGIEGKTRGRSGNEKEFCLFLDIDSLRTLAVINSHNLGIDVYVVGSNSVKIYKNNGQTNKI